MNRWICTFAILMQYYEIVRDLRLIILDETHEKIDNFFNGIFIVCKFVPMLEIIFIYNLYWIAIWETYVFKLSEIML